VWPGRVFYDVDLIAENFLTRSNDERPGNLVGNRALHGVGVDVTVPRLGVRLAFEVKNLTDDQTSDAAGFPLPGRSVFFTVSYGFGAPARRRRLKRGEGLRAPRARQPIGARRRRRARPGANRASASASSQAR
jgi:hypothetical protein